MGFLDLIKKGVVEEFTGTISTGDLFLSLIIAFVCAIFITYIYKKTYTGVSYTKSFVLSIILLSMVTSLVIRTINSNLALSLGMVGALSIVRFRTAVKDPVDTIFMFWAIAVGIMSGAGLYLITIIACALTYLICYFIPLQNEWTVFFVRLAICIVVPNVIFFIIYSRRKEFNETLQLVNRMTKGKIKFLRKYEILPQIATTNIDSQSSAYYAQSDISNNIKSVENDLSDGDSQLPKSENIDSEKEIGSTEND